MNSPDVLTRTWDHHGNIELIKRKLTHLSHITLQIDFWSGGCCIGFITDCLSECWSFDGTIIRSIGRLQLVFILLANALSLLVKIQQSPLAVVLCLPYCDSYVINKSPELRSDVSVGTQVLINANGASFGFMLMKVSTSTFTRPIGFQISQKIYLIKNKIQFAFWLVNVRTCTRPAVLQKHNSRLL